MLWGHSDMGDIQIDSFMAANAANAGQDGEAKDDSEVCDMYSHRKRKAQMRQFIVSVVARMLDECRVDKFGTCYLLLLR